MRRSALRMAMMRCVAVTAIAAALLTGALTDPTDAPGSTDNGCSLQEAVATLFPKASRVGLGLRTRIDHGRQVRRAPFYPGYCGQWWTEYRGSHGYVDVSITIYRTARQLDAPLGEPAYMPVKVFADGARMRVAYDGGGVVSVMRNLFISTTSSYLPTDANRVPDFTGGPDLGLRVQLKIHRLAHQAILTAG